MDASMHKSPAFKNNAAPRPERGGSRRIFRKYFRDMFFGSKLKNLAFAGAVVFTCATGIATMGCSKNAAKQSQVSAPIPCAVSKLIQMKKDKNSECDLRSTEDLEETAFIITPDLILALKDKEDVVRKKAALALGEMGSVEALPALTNALEDDCPKVRAAAAEALRMTTHVYPPAVKLALTRALKDIDPGVRYAVGEALLSEYILSDNGDFLPSPTLIRAALKHNDPEVRKAAAEALGRSRDISVVLTLAKAANDEFPEVRKAAIRSLAEFGEYASPATPALIRTLRDPNEGVRVASSGVLCAVGKASAVPALIQALKDTNRDVRKNAAKALGIFRASTAIPSLLQILKNGDKLDRQYGVDWDAAHAIANMGKHGMWVLIRALESNNMRTRYVAAEALGELGKNATPAIPYLDRAAKDGNILVKTHVEWALITIKNGTESWYKGEEKWEFRHGYCITGTKQEYAHTP